jgi:hypothetical protein
MIHYRPAEGAMLTMTIELASFVGCSVGDAIMGWANFVMTQRRFARLLHT